MSVSWSKCLCKIALCIGTAGISSAALAVTLPADTTLPVEFPKTLDAAKLHAGDKVSAKTMQVVILPNGDRLAKGTVLVGHVVEAQPFQFDSTDYAVQKPSYLAIHFDSLVEKNTSLPITVSVRALAGAVEAQEAESPHYTDESDSLGEMVLVGGAHYRGPWKNVYAMGDDGDEDIVAYNRSQGVFAHLIAAPAQGVSEVGSCKGTQTEQSIGIFSPNACGVYGYGSVQMTKPMNEQRDGIFRLQCRHQTVRINSGTAALLQVIAE